MKTELMVQLDGLSTKDDSIFLLAASNLPWDLDAAMLRRMEKRVKSRFYLDLCPIAFKGSKNGFDQGFLA